MSERRDLADWYATAHAAVPGVRRGAVAKHVRLLLRLGVRIWRGRRTDEEEPCRLRLRRLGL